MAEETLCCLPIISFQYFVFSEPKLSVLLLKLSVSKPLMIFPVFDSPHINILLSLISLPTSGIPSQCLFSLLIFKFRYVLSVFPFLLRLAYQAVAFQELFDVGEVLYIFYKPC